MAKVVYFQNRWQVAFTNENGSRIHVAGSLRECLDTLAIWCVPFEIVEG